MSDERINLFSGDPLLLLSLNGSRLVFRGGQPIMDQGLENAALIALLTEEGWIGNTLFNDENKKIGSNFIKVASRSITSTSLVDTARAAEEALSNSVFGNVTATAINPNSFIVEVTIIIEPPSGDAFGLALTKDGLNWQFQKINPAHGRV